MKLMAVMGYFRTERNQKWGQKIAKFNIEFQMDVTRELDSLLNF